MIDKVIPINSLLYINTKLFTNCMEGITFELFLKCPSDNVNNIAFIASHLLDARFFMGDIAGIKEVNPLKDLFDKIKSPKQIEDFPPAGEIIILWKDISGQIENKLNVISDEELLKESHLQLPLTEKNVLGALTFLLQHESYHIGQMAILRKLLGLPAMRYI